VIKIVHNAAPIGEEPNGVQEGHNTATRAAAIQGGEIRLLLNIHNTF
jgi:hypothetical protein